MEAIFTEINGLAAQTFHHVIVNDKAKISRIGARNNANSSHLDLASGGCGYLHDWNILLEWEPVQSEEPQS